MNPESPTFDNGDDQVRETKRAGAAQPSSEFFDQGLSGNHEISTERGNNVAVFTQTPTDRLNREIDFALLLADLIRTVERDPEQLRLTIYAFARVKLANELSWATPSERESLLHSLEVAIRGVEKFSKRPEQVSVFSDTKALSSPDVGDYVNENYELNKGIPEAGGEILEIKRETPVHFVDVEAIPSRRPFFSPRKVAASILLLIVFGGILAGTMVLGSVFLLRDRIAQTISPIVSGNAVQHTIDAHPKAVPAPPPPSEFPIPGDYGVYAIANGALKELEVLSEQVPDKRIAMSTPITQPSRTNLPDGRVKFVVYRRDFASNTPERVDVRVVAQVTRAVIFDSKGKPNTAPVSGAWNIRNISFGLRVRPLPGSSEMLLIQPESADFILKPGRYILVLKNQGYDFTVGGKITDPAQCLERTEAANGVFYSECKNT
ncbi:hypothetical protein [Bradyrhizobium sp. 76]|uniref:hypothetical protein n=1 Tax=Bradyrhizobium sp. 76 TaxID=2782680 RepID=UPI001FFB89A2|nr:hypothetical protein [Bradyrhizobium sp. 76]MCK1406050.1 hypothetical protein [Bradyrhizobium sp. 76]